MICGLKTDLSFSKFQLLMFCVSSVEEIDRYAVEISSVSAKNLIKHTKSLDVYRD